MVNIWLQVNGEIMPTPRSFAVTYSTFDSDDSVRNEKGYLNRTVIRKGHTAVDFGFCAAKSVFHKGKPKRSVCFQNKKAPSGAFLFWLG
ncbi:MAG: hypothetical protein ACI4KA_11215 [Oscillospiraceae bacterium]